jgi:hypothetical protein
MSRLTSLLAFALLLFAACSTDTKQQESTPTSLEKPAAQPVPVGAKLLCEPVVEPNMQADAPQHQVFLTAGEQKVKVADILNCSPLTPDQYGQYQIPANALDAVLGWWAGAGDILYITRENNGIVVKKGTVAEEMEGNDFGYETVFELK